MFMDTAKEKEINLGKDYPFEPLAGGECIVPSKYQGLGVQIGDEVQLTLKMGHMLRALSH